MRYTHIMAIARLPSWPIWTQIPRLKSAPAAMGNDIGPRSKLLCNGSGSVDHRKESNAY